MAKQTFGFMCGEFSVALSGNGVVMPGSRDQPLKKSLLPYAAMDDCAGPYTLDVKSGGAAVCHMPVHVLWVGHETQPEAFLGFRPENPEEMRVALGAYIGMPVELEFTPVEAKSAI
jgi:hypothetical protein